MIKNVITDGFITDHRLYDRLLETLDNIRLSNDHLKENYNSERLDLLGHKSFDLLLSERNDIVCFSGMYHRSEWPEGCYRISNRTYVNPKYRTSIYNYLNPSMIGPHQIAIHKKDIKMAFISRESFKGKYYFKALKRTVPYYTDWNTSDNMIQLFNSSQKSSYQYIVYKEFVENSLSKFKSISENEWKNLT